MNNENEEYIVTSVKKLKRNLYKVGFNEELMLNMSDETLASNNIKTGKIIDKTAFDEMIRTDGIKRAKSRGLEILSRSSKSRHQVLSTLKREGFTEEAIEASLDFLKQYSFIDDKKLAKNIAVTKVPARKWSKRQLDSALRQKGIDKKDIEMAVENIDDDTELENAVYLAEKKYRSLSSKSEEEKKKKIIQSLSYKGFSYDTIKKALAAVKLDGDENEYL